MDDWPLSIEQQIVQEMNGTIETVCEVLQAVQKGASFVVDGHDTATASFSLATTHSIVGVEASVGRDVIAMRDELAFVGLTAEGRKVHVARRSIPPGSCNW